MKEIERNIKQMDLLNNKRNCRSDVIGINIEFGLITYIYDVQNQAIKGIK